VTTKDTLDEPDSSFHMSEEESLIHRDDFAGKMRRLVPSLTRFFLDEHGNFQGHSVRSATADGPQTPKPKKSIQRCPTVTCQLMLACLELGIDNWRELSRRLSNFGVTLAQDSHASMPLDMLAIRLLLTNKEVKYIDKLPRGRNVSQVAIDLIGHYKARFTNGEDGDPKEMKKECKQWITDLLNSSMHGRENAQASTQIVLIGNLLAALTDWRLMKAGQLAIKNQDRLELERSTSRDGTTEGREKSAFDPLLAIADHRLHHMLRWLIDQTENADGWTMHANCMPYFAAALHSMKRLSRCLENSPIGVTYDDECSDPIPVNESISQLDDRMREWVDGYTDKLLAKLQAELSAPSSPQWNIKPHDTSYDNVRRAQAKGAFLYLTKAILAPRTERHRIDFHDSMDTLLESLANAGLPKEHDGFDACCGDHDQAPAPSEIVFAITRAAYWPEIGPRLLSPKERTRFAMAVKLIDRFLSSEQGTDRIMEVRDGDGFLIKYDPDSTKKDLSHLASAWESYLTVRIVYMGLRMSWALARDSILKKYNATSGSNAQRQNLPSLQLRKWTDIVADAESYTAYSSTIFRQFLRPLIERAALRDTCIRPAEERTSFILYGPPGSGKTYAVEKLAEQLGWPLVSLSPSNFIRKGEDNIESSATEIFGDLGTLYEAIVFFDECDELFRSRSAESVGARSVLSFATASMLPKIQRLSKQRRVLFALATNYLQNIDDAVRRDGRFDAQLLVDRPHTGERLKFIVNRLLHQKHFRKLEDYISEHAPRLPPEPGSPDYGSAVGSKAEAPGELLLHKCRQLQALLSLLILRSTHGFSYTQTNSAAKSILRVIPRSQEIFSLTLGADELEKVLDTAIRSVLGSGPEQPPSIYPPRVLSDHTVPTSIRHTWPIPNERQYYYPDDRQLPDEDPSLNAAPSGSESRAPGGRGGSGRAVPAGASHIHAPVRPEVVDSPVTLPLLGDILDGGPLEFAFDIQRYARRLDKIRAAVLQQTKSFSEEDLVSDDINTALQAIALRWHRQAVSKYKIETYLAFELRANEPPHWPAGKTGDYLEWIASRASAELRAANVEHSKYIQLMTYWVTIPGYHTFMRDWKATHIRD